MRKKKKRRAYSQAGTGGGGVGGASEETNRQIFIDVCAVYISLRYTEKEPG